MNRRFNSHHLAVLFLVAATLITSTPSMAFADDNAAPAIAGHLGNASEQSTQNSENKSSSDPFKDML